MISFDVVINSELLVIFFLFFVDAGNTPVSLLGKRAAPPPNRKMSGTIDVIGTTARDSRRPAQLANNSEPIPTTDSND